MSLNHFHIVKYVFFRLGGGGGDKLQGFQYPGFTQGSNALNAFFKAEPIQRHNEVGRFVSFLEKFPAGQRVSAGVATMFCVSLGVFKILQPSNTFRVLVL